MINYTAVTGLVKQNGKVCGVRLKDHINDQGFEVRAKSVINATRIFTDSILKMDDGNEEPLITLSQGIHIVLDKEFLPGNAAILVPETDDGRVLFAVPWHNKVLVGTTDTPVTHPSLEPVALKEEIAFILNHIGRYLSRDPVLGDIRSVYAGLRPLVRGNARHTAALSRDHLIQVSDSSLLTIAGGKWTTYRKMAEDVVNVAITKAGLDEKPCVTRHLKVHGWKDNVNDQEELYYYGADSDRIMELVAHDPLMGAKIHLRLPYIKAEIIWAVQEEMCMTVEDALARRTRALLLDAKAAIESSPVVAALMAGEMNKDETWQKTQVISFKEVANKYLP